MLLQLTVRIDIEIKLQNELVDNPLALKNGCASQIQTAFNTNTNGEIDSVLTIDGSTSCGSGTYNYLEGQPTWNYRCRGSRKYHFTNGERFCCKFTIRFSRWDFGTYCAVEQLHLM